MSYSNEMLAVVTASLFSAIVPLLHIILAKLTGKEEKSIQFMFLSFFTYMLCWSAFMYAAALCSTTAIIAGLAAAGFWCLGYMEAFSMVCRGFSLRIMVDLYLREQMTFSEILTGYGDGLGVDWMLKKRIESMQKARLVELEGQVLVVKSPLGTLAGKLGNLVKKILKMGKGGQ